MDFSRLPKYIPPNEALDLLEEILDNLNMYDDNEILENTWQVLKRCSLPQVLAGPKVILYEHEINQPIYQRGIIGRILPEALCHLLQSGIMVLVNTGNRMEEQGFNSPGMKYEICVNVKSIRAYLERIQTMLPYFKLPLNFMWLMRDNINSPTYRIISLMKRSHPFEAMPSKRYVTSRLWHKLSQTSCKQLMAKAKGVTCCICLDEFGDEFAIVDCCSHLVCLKCAHRAYSIREDYKRRCPLCRAHVGTYTSARNFVRFRESLSFKKAVQNLLWSIKSKLKF